MVQNRTADSPLTKVERQIYCSRRYLSIQIEDDPEFMQEQGRLIEEYGKWMKAAWGGVTGVTLKDKLSESRRRYNELHKVLIGEAKIHGLDKPRGRPLSDDHPSASLAKFPPRRGFGNR